MFPNAPTRILMKRMNNSSTDDDEYFAEENIICSYSATFCIALGATFEFFSIIGLLLNLLLIFIFVKFEYCKKDPVLILTFSLFLCDCFHLLILTVHLSPEMIDADNITTWDWWDETMNFVVFYFWLVNLFFLAIICRVRYEATCDYAKFRQIYTKKKLYTYAMLIWMTGLLICMIPLLQIFSLIPIFSINISLAQDMNEKDSDDYLEYMLHLVHTILVLWMIFFYTKCVLFMNQNANRMRVGSTTSNENLVLKRRRQNFRLSLHYLSITVAFVFLIACWLSYKLVGTNFATVATKKVAYFVNSMIASLIFVVTNSTFWKDFSSLFSRCHG